MVELMKENRIVKAEDESKATGTLPFPFSLFEGGAFPSPSASLHIASSAVTKACAMLLSALSCSRLRRSGSATQIQTCLFAVRCSLAVYLLFSDTRTQMALLHIKPWAEMRGQEMEAKCYWKVLNAKALKVARI